MTTAELISRTITRLGDDPATPNQSHYTRGEVLVALNQVYRLMAFLTLCLETTVTASFSVNVAFYKMLLSYSDWILPLRITLASGRKLRPNRLADLAALDSNWSVKPGIPERYAIEGFDLLCLYKQPKVITTATIVYARSPAPLIDDDDSPEMQTEYHQSLIDGAIPLLRVKEGAQEFLKTLPLWDRYLDQTMKLGNYVRARNKEQGYDHVPFELARFDRSKLMEVARGA